MNDNKEFFNLLDQKHQVIMDITGNIKTVIHMFSADERIEFINTIMDGYCKHCGYEVPDHQPCFCQNDE